MGIELLGEQLNKLIHAADANSTERDQRNWAGRVAQFLRRTIGPEIAGEFLSISYPSSWVQEQEAQVGMLEGLLVMETPVAASVPVVGATAAAGPVVTTSKRVFVVHGHDDGTKQAVARYLERLGLEAVILHEKPNEGRTVIDKFERHSDVAFAVVLLTPDDVGAAKSEAADLKPRARQNVVFELGYFVGKLTRARVCALHKGGVELPSDLQGVLYVELDEKGAWRLQLAQELMNVRLPINLEAVLKG